MSDACLEIDVQLFAAAVELAGSRRMQLSLPVGATVADLRRAVTAHCPPLTALVENSRWAVGTEFVPDNFAFTGSLSVALIPPVSGG